MRTPDFGSIIAGFVGLLVSFFGLGQVVLIFSDKASAVTIVGILLLYFALCALLFRKARNSSLLRGAVRGAIIGGIAICLLLGALIATISPIPSCC